MTQFLAKAALFVLFVCLLAATIISNAAGLPPALPPKPVRFDFQMVGVAQVVQLIYAEALKSPYVIDPEVLTDARQVSFRYEANHGDSAAFVRSFLDSLGLAVESRNGVDFVTKKKPEEKLESDHETLVYRPHFRDVNYLTRMLTPMFSGKFLANRSVSAPPGAKLDKQAPEGSAAALIDQSADVLVFAGSPKEVHTLKKLLADIDQRQGEVMVRGVVYEVSSSDKDGSAFTLALNLLGGKLTMGMGAANVLDTFARVKSQSIDAVFSALSVDSRFKVVSTPSLRVRSGGSGRFTVGQDVPVLGAITYPGNGQAPIQSVEYRSSGVIFDLQPQVRDDVVDLSVSQQLSNFVATETGVNNSPTLIKREVKTALSLADGDVVVLGGLAENKESAGRNGLSFVPAWLRSKSNESSKTEILLILQLTRI